ncbi:hypothetical protein EDC01DRAFT_70881 [Geopyxis carbonaria]|nr:hypothetical protein EDC01DRAFT_70881 [Geopyxis carbonaria]
MVSPRTPLHKTRYGPSGVGGAGGRVGGGGGSDVIRRKKVPGLGLGIDEVVGVGASSFDSRQNNNGYSELFSDDELVSRAREAFARAERSGASTVDLEEREWEAWQRHEAIEQEVERRVMERLRMQEETRRKVTVPAPSRGSPRPVPVGSSSTSPAPAPAPAPGFLVPGNNGFTAIGGSTSPRVLASRSVPSLSARLGSSSPDLVGQERHSRGLSSSVPPPSPTLSGSFPDEDPPAYTPSPQSFSRPSSPPPSAIASPVLPRRGLASGRTSPTKRPLPPLPARDNLAPQPGSSYYPGMHPSLASRSESDVSRLELGSDSGSDDSGFGTATPPVRRTWRGTGGPPRQT